MLKKTIVSLALLGAFAAQAQTAPAPASSPAKKDAIARIIKVQQPNIEAIARGLVERPAIEIMNSAGQVISQRVPKEKQEATFKEVEGEVRKFVDESGALAQKRALALAPAAIGAVLEEKFTEDELKQIASALENPAIVKYQGTIPAMQQAILEKLVADTRPTIEPKLRALDEQIARKLGVAPPPAGAAPAASKKK